MIDNVRAMSVLKRSPVRPYPVYAVGDVESQNLMTSGSLQASVVLVSALLCGLVDVWV